jgi:hypothetical protein
MGSKEINIEEIMDQIRAGIKEKGLKESELKLPDIMQYYTDDMKPSLAARIKNKIKKMTGRR